MIAKFLLKCLLILSATLWVNLTIFAQERLTLTLEGGDKQVGEQICLPLVAENFTNILGMQFSLTYDPSILAFDKIDNPNRSLRIDLEFIEENFGLPGVGQIPEGTITFVWFGAGARPVNLEDGTTLFELCFTVLEADETIVQFSQEPTPIQIVDGNDQVIAFSGNGTFVNKEKVPTGPSFTVDTDTSVVEVDFLQIIERNNIPLNNHVGLTINNGPAVDLKFERLNLDIPEQWVTQCTFEVGTQPFDCEVLEGMVSVNDTTTISFHLILNQHNRQSGTATAQYLLYDAQDSLNSHQIITFQSRFQYPEIDGPSFSIVPIQKTDTLFINQISTLPQVFNFGKSIVSNTDLEPIQVNWQLLDSQIPDSWEVDCSSSPALCPGSAMGSVMVAPSGNTPLSAQWTINQLNTQQNDRISLRYLFYDPADSLRSHYIIEETFTIIVPDLTKGTFVLQSDSLFRSFGAQQDANDLLEFFDTVSFRVPSIFPVEIGWRVIDQSFPENWSLMTIFEFPDNRMVGTGIQENGQFMMDQTSFTIPVYFAVEITNQTPGTAEFEVELFDVNDPSNTQRLRFSYQVCPPPLKRTLINIPAAEGFCPGSEITVSTSPEFLAYNWTNGATTSATTLSTDDEITLEIQDIDRCFYRDTTNVKQLTPFQDSICIVTYDIATGKNRILWTKTDAQRTITHTIYRAVEGSSNLTPIGVTDFSGPSFFIDEQGDPQGTRFQYAISTTDSCGSSSELSRAHLPVFLQLTDLADGRIQLDWTPYEGAEYELFNIWRGPTPEQLEILTQSLNSNFSFIDNSPPSGTIYYQISIDQTTNCTSSEMPMGSFSNLAGRQMTNVHEQSLNEGAYFKITPNPVSHTLHIDWLSKLPTQAWTLRLISPLGRSVQSWPMEGQRQMSLPIDLPAGFYTLIATNQDGMAISQKLIIQQ